MVKGSLNKNKVNGFKKLLLVFIILQSRHLSTDKKFIGDKSEMQFFIDSVLAIFAGKLKSSRNKLNIFEEDE